MYPAWVSNALGGVRECIDPGIFVAGKTNAATLIDRLMQPEELEKARAEFNDRTGGGVGGTDWVAPLLPSDFPPPVDLRLVVMQGLKAHKTNVSQTPVSQINLRLSG